MWYDCMTSPQCKLPPHETTYLVKWTSIIRTLVKYFTSCVSLSIVFFLYLKLFLSSSGRASYRRKLRAPVFLYEIKFWFHLISQDRYSVGGSFLSGWMFMLLRLSKSCWLLQLPAERVRAECICGHARPALPLGGLLLLPVHSGRSGALLGLQLRGNTRATVPHTKIILPMW